MTTKETHAAIQTGANKYRVVEVEMMHEGMVIGLGSYRECKDLVSMLEDLSV